MLFRIPDLTTNATSHIGMPHLCTRFNSMLANNNNKIKRERERKTVPRQCWLLNECFTGLYFGRVVMHEMHIAHCSQQFIVHSFIIYLFCFFHDFYYYCHFHINCLMKIHLISYFILFYFISHSNAWTIITQSLALPSLDWCARKLSVTTCKIANIFTHIVLLCCGDEKAPHLRCTRPDKKQPLPVAFRSERIENQHQLILKQRRRCYHHRRRLQFHTITFPISSINPTRSNLHSIRRQTSK